MYIDSLRLENFRNFRKSEVTFVHPDRRFSAGRLPKPALPNINLLLGNNGLGKTTLLKAVALAALGPAVGDSGIYPYRLIRREPKDKQVIQPQEAVIEAAFVPHEQDEVLALGIDRVESRVMVVRRGDLELLRWQHPDEKLWHPIFSSSSPAFFFVGYGATRRVEKREQVDLGSRRSSAFARAQRVQSLFEESYSLVPLNVWLPKLESRNPKHFRQAHELINRLLGEGRYSFTGKMAEDEYVFSRGGLEVTFPALSDGYRAFLGWVGDLLYHVCMTCPDGKNLVDNKGIVMVDEVDLHLHPGWQMSVLQTLATELPNIQFIVTSHSALVVGSLEWMNIIVMTPGPEQSSQAQRVEQAVHGLDADQVLLTDFFGLESTRAPGKGRMLKELSLKARGGDTEAAKQLLEQMSRGMEEPLKAGPGDGEQADGSATDAGSGGAGTPPTGTATDQGFFSFFRRWGASLRRHWRLYLVLALGLAAAGAAPSYVFSGPCRTITDIEKPTPITLSPKPNPPPPATRTPLPPVSPTRTPSPTPSPARSPTPSPRRSPTPSPTRSLTPSPTRSPTPTPTPSPKPSPSPTPRAPPKPILWSDPSRELERPSGGPLTVLSIPLRIVGWAPDIGAVTGAGLHRVRAYHGASRLARATGSIMREQLRHGTGDGQ